MGSEKSGPRAGTSRIRFETTPSLWKSVTKVSAPSEFLILKTSITNITGLNAARQMRV